MTIINDVKELKAAIRAGKSPLLPGNTRMRVIMAAVARVFKLTGGAKVPSAEVLSQEIIIENANPVGAAGAISTPVAIALIIASMFTIISIVAICKGLELELVWDAENKVFKLVAKKRT